MYKELHDSRLIYNIHTNAIEREYEMNTESGIKQNMRMDIAKDPSIAIFTITAVLIIFILQILEISSINFNLPIWKR
jgi:hypothetical protein